MQKFITTRELAAFLGITPGAIRRRLCVHGSYYRLTPEKLPNGRLLWSTEEVEKLTKKVRK